MLSEHEVNNFSNDKGVNLPMRMKRGVAAYLLLVSTVLGACSSDDGGNAPQITVKKAVKSRKKGRIY